MPMDTLCMRVFRKFFSCRWCSDGNWKAVYCHSTPYYLVASREVLYVCSGSFVNTHSHKHTQYARGICMPPTWLSPSITPRSTPRPPLSRSTPAVTVMALPAGPLCCFKASLCSLDSYTLLCFLIICLHHRMHFYST